MVRYLTCPSRQLEIQREKNANERQQRKQSKSNKIIMKRHKTSKSRMEHETRRKQKRVTKRKYCNKLVRHKPRQNPSEMRPTNSERNERQFISSQSNLNSQQSIDEDRFYVIEKLLDKRFLNGREEYLVRWQNYPPEWDSWEPRCEIERNSSDMIYEFERIPRPTSDEDKLHCICRRPYRFNQGGMIQCYNCQEWYHFTCLEMNMAEANAYSKWQCSDCFRSNPTLKNLIKPEKRNLVHDFIIKKEKE